MSDHPRCPWCGHPDDCQPGTPGKSRHHELCCADWYRPACEPCPTCGGAGELHHVTDTWSPWLRAYEGDAEPCPDCTPLGEPA